MERLTVEDKIMGRTEPLPKTELQLKAFTSETEYKVNTIGLDNPSIMKGSFLDRILPLYEKEAIKSGVKVVEYNGLRIERLDTVVEEETPTVEETPKPRRRRSK